MGASAFTIFLLSVIVAATAASCLSFDPLFTPPNPDSGDAGSKPQEEGPIWNSDF